MSNQFSMVSVSNVSSGRFDLSHDVKTSFDMGELVPMLCQETFPGDNWNIRPEIFLRFAPLVSPVMHEITVNMHFFFVPNRIMWPNWENFITGNGDPVWPNANNTSQISPGDLGDYLGINASTHSGQQVSAFPCAAYALIYDEFYRDQNLQLEAFTMLVDGHNAWITTMQNGPVLKRAWNHDYFTSCLPDAQKGNPVTIPLGTFTDVPVILDSSQGNMKIVDSFGGTEPNDTFNTDANSILSVVTGAQNVWIDPQGSYLADTSTLEAMASEITDLRRAFRLQEFLEKEMRGGSRYIESTMVHFGVESSDGRYHRPEYLGGSKQHMVISEVLSTAETATAPIGEYAGHGLSVGNGNPISFYCQEHGWIMALLSVRPRTSYQEGIHRQFRRMDRFDYPWPEFARIGEQAVEVREVYGDTATEAELDETFGYIPRFAELKYINSRVCGDMRDTLDHWHLGRQFTSKPALNSDFIECNPDKRIFAVPSEHGIYGHIIFNIGASRKFPMFSSPSI